ncbi:MAG: hypothetical protein Q3Y08_11335 [Butyricicoccus sp.]|nr:hypothetical protein [Butyricicoccus sp.]
MKQCKAKLASNRGETLVETLAAILVATLSVALLIGSVTASFQLGRQADQSDAYFYQTLTAAENRENPTTDGVSSSPTVRVTEGGTTVTLDVQVYGDEGLYAYARNADADGDTP